MRSPHFCAANERSPAVTLPANQLTLLEHAQKRFLPDDTHHNLFPVPLHIRFVATNTKLIFSQLIFKLCTVNKLDYVTLNSCENIENKL